MESAFISKVFCTPYKAVKQFIAKNTTITLNVLLLCFSFILVIMSIFALCIINWQMFVYEFSFTPSGIDAYLSKYGDYKALFSATVATIVAYLGLLRYKAATDANVEKVKQDRFIEWKCVLEERLANIEVNNPIMKRCFIKVRYNLYEKLFDINFRISSKTQLKNIFESTFKKEDLPKVFESGNKKYQVMGGVYYNNVHSYCFQDFYFIMSGCIYEFYTDFYLDLNELFVSMLPSDRVVDEESFKVSAKLHGYVI